MEDLETCFKLTLKLCRFIGLLPFSRPEFDLYGRALKTRSWRSNLPGIIVVLVLTTHVAVGIGDVIRNKRFTNLRDSALEMMMFAFYGTGTVTYLHYLRGYPHLQRVFHKWSRLKLNFTQRDATLYRDVNLITVIVMSSAILENAVNHLRYKYAASQDFFQLFGYNVEKVTFLELYYRMNCGAWERLVPYSIPMSLYAYVSEKLVWYGWNASDVIIIIFSRAICGKFKHLYLEATALVELHSEDQHNSRESLQNAKSSWRRIIQDHQSLWCLLSDVRELLSPLIFLSIVSSTYFFCMQLHFGLSVSSNVTLLDNVYAVWSIAHIWLRLCAICIVGSRVKHWAHKLGYLLKQCPSSAISLDVVRAEQYISSNDIGFTGLGCFTLTNGLLLKIISIVITYEVMILQVSKDLGLLSSSRHREDCSR